MIQYRKDIDGLRALAVLAVIFYHLGVLPNGYLGVDVFFVISGFLITSIIYREWQENRFKISHFYVRRIRRILPLLFFVSTTALILGVLLMLPNDLENLAQSVVASNISLNNLLMYLTSSDYWAVKNEYKPLIHTWSLGVEEQFYLLYPIIFFLVAKYAIKHFSTFLLIISVLSLFLFIFSGSAAARFYLLPYRFFELSFGGYFAISHVARLKNSKFVPSIFYLSILGLFVVLVMNELENRLGVILISIFSILFVTSGKEFHDPGNWISNIFQNKFAVYIGKISFSLYLWHQVLFAFTRYAFVEEINFSIGALLLLLSFLLSIFTFTFIEKPFRDKNKFSTRTVLIILAVVFLISTLSALYLYRIGGVYKDFPELELSKEKVEKMGYNSFSKNQNIHINYNEKVRELEKDFTDLEKKKILVVGNSFARDVANIFLELPNQNELEIRYLDPANFYTDAEVPQRFQDADVIAWTAFGYFNHDSIKRVEKKLKTRINSEKFYVFGNKNYGYSNGIPYHKSKKMNDLSQYYTKIPHEVIELDSKLQEEWKSKYISMIQAVLNEENKIRVFTDKGTFISQDMSHLTESGARFYDQILEDRLKQMLQENGNDKP